MQMPESKQLSRQHKIILCIFLEKNKKQKKKKNKKRIGAEFQYRLNWRVSGRNQMEYANTGSNSVRSSNINATTNWTLGRWIPETTEQNLIKFILLLYHEVQSMFSVLVDRIFPGKHFLSAFNFRNSNRKWAKHRQMSTQICFKQVLRP